MVLSPGSHYINLHLCVWVSAKLPQSCPTLWDPMDCSRPGSSVHGIFQARILEWVALAFPKPRIKPASLVSSALTGGFITTSTTWQILYHLSHQGSPIST